MKCNSKKSSVLFYVAFGLYYLSIFITYTLVPYSHEIKQIMAMMTIVCLGLNFIRYSYYTINLKERGTIPIILFIAGITVLSAIYHDYFIIVLLMFFINLRRYKIDVMMLFRISIYLLSIATLLVILLCLVGVLENRVTFRAKGDFGARYAWGFYHSNVLPIVLLYWWIYYYILKKRITVVNFGVALLTNSVVYVLCNSRNSFFSLLLLLLLLLGYESIKRYKRRYRVQKAIAYIGKYGFIIFALLSFVLLVLYKRNNPVGLLMNTILSNRLSMGAIYFFRFQHPKFIQLMTSEYFKVISLTLDNGYFYSVARYGFVYLLFLCGLLTFCGKEFERLNNYYAMIACVILAVSNSIDNGFFSFQFYPFILLAMYGFNQNIHRRNNNVFFTLQEYIHWRN